VHIDLVRFTGTQRDRFGVDRPLSSATIIDRIHSRLKQCGRLLIDDSVSVGQLTHADFVEGVVGAKRVQALVVELQVGFPSAPFRTFLLGRSSPRKNAAR